MSPLFFSEDNQYCAYKIKVSEFETINILSNIEGNIQMPLLMKTINGNTEIFGIDNEKIATKVNNGGGDPVDKAPCRGSSYSFNDCMKCVIGNFTSDLTGCIALGLYPELIIGFGVYCGMPKAAPGGSGATDLCLQIKAMGFKVLCPNSPVQDFTFVLTP